MKQQAHKKRYHGKKTDFIPVKKEAAPYVKTEKPVAAPTMELLHDPKIYFAAETRIDRIRLKSAAHIADPEQQRQDARKIGEMRATIEDVVKICGSYKNGPTITREQLYDKNKITVLTLNGAYQFDEFPTVEVFAQLVTGKYGVS